MKKILVIISLIIAWMGIIFAFSNMPGEESSDKSIGAIKLVITKAIKITNKLRITDLSQEKIDSISEDLNGPLRKCAHATEYFILSVLIFLLFDTLNFNETRSFLLPVALSFLYACTDEFHQLFVVNRSGQFTDVLIDTMGAIIGGIVISIIYRIRNKVRRVECK